MLLHEDFVIRIRLPFFRNRSKMRRLKCLTSMRVTSGMYPERWLPIQVTKVLFLKMRVALSSHPDSSINMVRNISEMVKLKMKRENQRRCYVLKKVLHVQRPMLPAPKQIHLVPAPKKMLVSGHLEQS